MFKMSLQLQTEGATGVLPGGNVLAVEAASVLPGVTTVSAAMDSKAYAQLIEKAIQTTNKNGKVCPSNAARIQKFMILPRDFSVTTDELTATFKLKRNTVMTKFADQIERMYNSKDVYVKYDGPIPE
jgi:long-subunit acyl-CoA synthetase (AMP-forming)